MSSTSNTGRFMNPTSTGIRSGRGVLAKRGRSGHSSKVNDGARHRGVPGGRFLLRGQPIPSGGMSPRKGIDLAIADRKELSPL